MINVRERKILNLKKQILPQVPGKSAGSNGSGLTGEKAKHQR